jgi:2-polyprenyl-3-methyl-5-hydroxy-6-metoxy-1,4-benzoquinol methylase
VTSEDFGASAAIDARYAREWLSALTSAGYIDYDPSTCRFTLPAEHAIALAGEGGVMFMGGAFEQLPALIARLDDVAAAFRTGAGVPPARYGDDLWKSMERVSAGWFDNLLVHEWIPAMPDAKIVLERGARVADVGSGSGRAVINMARAFPRSRFVGYDTLPEAVERGAANAEAAGVGHLVNFALRDVHDGLDGPFDIVTAFDVIHDTKHPRRAFEAIRESLAPDGILMLLEINARERLEENAGPVAAILYSTSVLYCTPIARAAGGEGLGTMGLPEPAVRRLCAEAGFRQVRRLPIENPFNVLYEIRP